MDRRAQAAGPGRGHARLERRLAGVHADAPAGRGRLCRLPVRLLGQRRRVRGEKRPLHVDARGRRAAAEAAGRALPRTGPRRRARVHGPPGEAGRDDVHEAYADAVGCRGRRSAPGPRSRTRRRALPGARCEMADRFHDRPSRATERPARRRRPSERRGRLGGAGPDALRSPGCCASGRSRPRRSRESCWGRRRAASASARARRSFPRGCRTSAAASSRRARSPRRRAAGRRRSASSARRAAAAGARRGGAAARAVPECDPDACRRPARSSTPSRVRWPGVPRRWRRAGT